MKKIILSVLSVMAFMCVSGNERVKLDRIKQRLSEGFTELRKEVVKEPSCFIKYPYLISAGFYSQL